MDQKKFVGQFEDFIFINKENKDKDD